MRKSFKEFMERVDRWCYIIASVSIYDLVDYDFQSAWEDGVNEKTVVRRVLKENGFFS